MASNRLEKDMKTKNDPPTNCSAAPKDGDMYKWEAVIYGSQFCIWWDFNLLIEFPPNYPFKPQMYLLPKFIIQILTWLVYLLGYFKR